MDIEVLLKHIHNPHFDPAKIAPSYYLLDRVEQATIPKIESRFCGVTGGRVYLKFVSDLVGLVLSIPDVSDCFKHD
jgi:hypothetical protein